MEVKIRKKVECEFYNKMEIVISINSGYFSITGTTFISNNVWESSGCIHDDIMEHFPSLEPIINLHLNDLNGRPMHFIENSMYYYANDNINGLINYGFNKRQAEYLIENKPNIDKFKLLISQWRILEIWKYKADMALRQIMEIYNENKEQ